VPPVTGTQEYVPPDGMDVGCVEGRLRLIADRGYDGADELGEEPRTRKPRRRDAMTPKTMINDLISETLATVYLAGIAKLTFDIGTHVARREAQSRRDEAMRLAVFYDEERDTGRVFSAARLDDGGGKDAIRWPPAVTPTCRNKTCPTTTVVHPSPRQSARGLPGSLGPVAWIETRQRLAFDQGDESQ
jgi:hypothetical protein